MYATMFICPAQLIQGNENNFYKWYFVLYTLSQRNMRLGDGGIIPTTIEGSSLTRKIWGSNAEGKYQLRSRVEPHTQVTIIQAQKHISPDRTFKR